MSKIVNVTADPRWKQSYLSDSLISLYTTLASTHPLISLYSPELEEESPTIISLAIADMTEVEKLDCESGSFVITPDHSVSDT